MEVLHLTERNEAAVVEAAVQHLKRGAVLAIPTDTVYGLASDVRNEMGVKKVFEIKGRGENQALPVFVRDISMAERYAMFDERARSFLEHVWPGRVSVVLKKRSGIPDIVTAGQATVALRIPDHPFIEKLLQAYPNPITGTSANISGEPAASTATDVQISFRDRPSKPDLLIDGGVLPPSSSSTIIDFTNSANPRILRMGAVTKGELDEFFAMWDNKK